MPKHGPACQPQTVPSIFMVLSLSVHAINILANAATRGSLNAHTADGTDGTALGKSLIIRPCGPRTANFENAGAAPGAMEK